MSGSAVFLDRDGTLIEDLHYLGDPTLVRLFPGVAAALSRLTHAGRYAIVVTNQSGIARGLMTEADYFATEHRVDELLSAEGARLDGHYFCPHLPDLNAPCECRKPGLLLYRQAAERFDLALDHCWWIGDRIRDLTPGLRLGGRGILVLTGCGAAEASSPEAHAFAKAADLGAAVDLVLRASG